MNGRKGEPGGLPWRQRSGRDDNECRHDSNGQGRVGVCRFVCREPLGFDTSWALHCAAKGEKNTVRVVTSAGKKMGLRTKRPKSAATLIFHPKMAMVGAP